MPLMAVTGPTSRTLLKTETLQARLGLADAQQLLLADVAEEASALVARYLRFEPAYASWSETFEPSEGPRLYLGARPVWAVTSVLDSAGVALGAEEYRLDVDASCLVRSTGWRLRTDPPSIVTLDGATEGSWAWTATYTAGWWLETMTGSIPSGVGQLPADVRRDFVAICRWLLSQENPLTAAGIKRTKNEGAEIEFFASSEVDRETGIPCNLTPGLSRWRRVG